MSAAAGRAVEAASAAGATDAEAYLSEDRAREVRVHGGEVESLSAATQRGVGVRAWIGHRAGYAYGTDLSEGGIEDVARRAVQAARVADEDEFAGPPPPPDAPGRLSPGAPAGGAPEAPGLTDATIEGWSIDRIAGLALAVERATLDADPRVAGVEQAVYADSAERVAIVSSTGVEGEYERSSCYGYVQALAEGDGTRETGLGFGLGRGPGALDAAAIGREGAARAVAMIGAAKPGSRSCPVVLEPTVAASFVALIGRGLVASAVQRGRSPFGERLGEEVADGALELHDDGLDPEGLASAPFDAEGVPRRRTALVAGRTLRSYLYDTYTARRAASSSTGSASRSGYRSQPSAATSNLIVAPGSMALDELLAEAGDGVLVTDVAGLHSGVNAVSGVFSVGASGRAIRGGEAAEPLREFTIAGDLVSMLGAARAVGADSRWVPFGGSVLTPSLLVAEMTVAGS